MAKIEPEQLHRWYREAVCSLMTYDYNVEADIPYEELSDGQKYIDKYIADKINKWIEDREREYYEFLDGPLKSPPPLSKRRYKLIPVDENE